jgi:chlorobactene glucosyltransferase
LTAHLAGVLVFLAALLLVALSNLAALRRLNAGAGLHQPPPRVSILLPVRDEQENIGPCVRTLLAQDYPDFEILVLDDHSTDQTREILEDLAAWHDRLHVITGQPLPAGWLGKLWANHQLAQIAQGDLLLFIDADTRHAPGALRAAAAAQQAQSADLLAVLPRQLIPTWGERLLVPVLYWSLLCFLPLALAHRVQSPTLSYAIGQYLLLRKSAYWQVGGFAAVRSNPADDLALARKVKAAGLRWRLVDGTNLVETRMYTGFTTAFNGLSKNLIAAFGYRALPYAFAWTWNAVAFLGPLFVLAWAFLASQNFILVPFTAPEQPAIWLAGFSAAIALVIWLLVAWRFRFPIVLVIAYPLIILAACLTAAASLLLTLSGKASWKGRTLTTPRLRWW